MAEVAQASQVLAANCGPGLDLDGDHPAIRGFQDGVYLGLVLGSVVVEARAFPGPGELAGEFHQHECLDPASRCAVGLAEAAGVLAEQVGGDAGIDEGQLGSADGALGLTRRGSA